MVGLMVMNPVVQRNKIHLKHIQRHPRKTHRSVLLLDEKFVFCLGTFFREFRRKWHWLEVCFPPKRDHPQKRWQKSRKKGEIPMMRHKMANPPKNIYPNLINFMVPLVPIFETPACFSYYKNHPQRLHSTKENPIFRTFPNGYHCVYSWKSTPTFPQC